MIDPFSSLSLDRRGQNINFITKKDWLENVYFTYRHMNLWTFITNIGRLTHPSIGTAWQYSCPKWSTLNFLIPVRWEYVFSVGRRSVKVEKRKNWDIHFKSFLKTHQTCKSFSFLGVGGVVKRIFCKFGHGCLKGWSFIWNPKSRGNECPPQVSPQHFPCARF